ncbi:MAG: AraC family transcriptional regulator [Clostridiales bacterium]|nr:AraC family transcriptional regulator [Clostridiales bacterium]
MNIKEEKIIYTGNVPCEMKLCRIGHVDPHYHSQELELIFCFEGSVTLVAGHQEVKIKAGEIFSVDYRDIHYLYSDEEKKNNLVLVFHLNLTDLKIGWDYLENLFFACESTHCYPYQQKAMEQVKDILLSLSYIHYSTPASEASSHITDESLCRSTANKLMDIMVKYFNWFNYENQDDHINLEFHDRFYRVLKHCNDNYKEKISVSQLAASEHISRNYFSQFVSKTVFSSFSFMIKYIRCYESEQLLLKTDMSIAEISYACGFSDPKRLYSSFKYWWQCTPTEHRNKYREYMDKPADISYLEGNEASSFIRDCITSWHLQKTLGSIL